MTLKIEAMGVNKITPQCKRCKRLGHAQTYCGHNQVSLDQMLPQRPEKFQPNDLTVEKHLQKRGEEKDRKYRKTYLLTSKKRNK